MKKTFLAYFLPLTLFSSAALASPIADDRVYAGEEKGLPIYGIKHSENFELVCDVTVTDREKKTKAKFWVDEDFELSEGKAPTAENFRVALGWPGGGKHHGVVGLEMVVEKLAIGRCLKKCLSIGVVTVEEDDEVLVRRDITVTEVGANRYKLTAKTEAGVTDIRGVCHLNEVP